LPRGVEAKRADRLASKIVEVLQRVIDIAERRADPREQPLARLRQRDAATLATSTDFSDKAA